MTTTPTREDLLASLRKASAPTNPVPPRATEKQLAYLRSLIAARPGNPAAVTFASRLDTLTSKGASAAITTLLGIPATQQAPAGRVSVPDGDYALRGDDGVVRFYTVSTGREGTRWEGVKFVSIHASEERYPVRGEGRKAVLSAIATDVAAAAALFGHEMKRCGFCSRQLTRPESLARGFGKDCGEKHHLL